MSESYQNPEVVVEGDRQIVRVGAWTLTVPNGSEEPKLDDEELATRLGHKRPRQVRDLIKRLVAEKEIDPPNCRRAVRRQSTGHGAMRDYAVDVYELDEDQALAVAMASKTPKGREVRRAMRQVFRAAVRGLLVPADVRALQSANVTLNARLTALEAGLGGVVGERDAKRFITGPLAEACRALCVAAGDISDGKRKSIALHLDAQVRLHVQFPKSAGQAWPMLPLARLGDAQCKVAELLTGARRAAEPLLKLAQTDMFKALQASGGVSVHVAP